MRECQAMIEPQAQKRGIRDQLFRGSSFLLYVKADRTRVKQVLINLLAQRDQVQQELEDRSSWTAARAPRDASASASRTPAQG